MGNGNRRVSTDSSRSLCCSPLWLISLLDSALSCNLLQILLLRSILIYLVIAMIQISVADFLSMILRLKSLDIALSLVDSILSPWRCKLIFILLLLFSILILPLVFKCKLLLINSTNQILLTKILRQQILIFQVGKNELMHTSLLGNFVKFLLR